MKPQRLTARTYLIIGLVAAMLLVLCGGGFLVRQFVYSPEAALRGYFAALADRDAGAALEYVAPSAVKAEGTSRELLTDKALEADGYVPPSDVTIEEYEPDSTARRVAPDPGTDPDGGTEPTPSDEDYRLFTVRYMLAGQTHSHVLVMRPDDTATLGVLHRWRIVSPVGSLLVVAPAGAPAKVNGIRVPSSPPASEFGTLPLAFPGRYSVTMVGNKLLEAKSQHVDVWWGRAKMTLDVRLKDSAREAAEEEVTAYLDKCAESTELDPPGCPFSAYSYADLTDVSWTIEDYPEIGISLSREGVVTVRSEEYGTALVTAEDDEGDEYDAEVTFQTYGTIGLSNGKITYYPSGT